MEYIESKMKVNEVLDTNPVFDSYTLFETDLENILFKPHIGSFGEYFWRIKVNVLLLHENGKQACFGGGVFVDGSR